METKSTPEQLEQKWYDKIWVVILLCILFFPVGLYALWKNSRLTDGNKLAIAGVIIIVLIILFGTPEKDQYDKANSTALTQTITKEVPEVSEEDKLKEQLQREITSFDKPFDNSSYRNTVEGIQMEVVIFSVWAGMIGKGENSTDEENKKLAASLKNKVTAIQIKEFPQMRKSYAKAAAEKLWESNIYVTTEGATNAIINLTGALFANNKNIADTQRALTDVFSQFRFKEVRYRWYKEADEFTYYKLEPPKDSEIKEVGK